jgi:hypothetical protein
LSLRGRFCRFWVYFEIVGTFLRRKKKESDMDPQEHLALAKVIPGEDKR